MNKYRRNDFAQDLFNRINSMMTNKEAITTPTPTSTPTPTPTATATTTQQSGIRKKRDVNDVKGVEGVMDEVDVKGIKIVEGAITRNRGKAGIVEKTKDARKMRKKWGRKRRSTWIRQNVTHWGGDGEGDWERGSTWIS